MMHLAEVELTDGNLDLSERTFREAIEMERQLSRKKHPVLAECLCGLAEVLLERGDAGAAEPLLREALDIQELRHVEGDRRIARTRSVLGASLTALGRFDEAEPLLRVSYEALLAECGPDHRATRAARERLVALYKSWGKPAEAALCRPTLTTTQPTAQR
jgi:hypothetical protein